MDLRGASADALATLRSELSGAVDGGADAATLGEELFTVARALRAEPTLRRVASDATIPAEAKQALMRDVLGGKAGEPTSALVATAVAQRWTLSRDLPDALERLSEISSVLSAGEDGDQLVDELFAVGQAVNDNGDLREALADPARSSQDKSSLVDSVLGGKVLPATLMLTKQALSGTYRTVALALSTYRSVAADVAGQTVATVRVTKPLAEDERTRLVEALSKAYDRQVHVNEIIDPAVLGGVRVEIGDDVIDGTISSRLTDARRRLVG
jgi:F-type H+-transporting ATPase subunit delta